SLLDGIPTDVVETGRFQPFTSDPHDLQQQVRPLAGGLQLQVNNFFGTLGFMARLVSKSSTMVAVSNQHVLTPVGVTDNQPTNAKHNDIGTTGAVVLSSQVDGGYINLTTTGVAAVYKWNGAGYSLIPIPGAVLVTTDDLPYPVWKTGITTGTTTGQITQLGLSGTSKTGWRFENQMVIVPDSTSPSGFSQAGDSGSAIVSSSLNRIAALLWGGDDRSGVSVACPIGPVLSQLGITVAVSSLEELQEPAVVPSFEEAMARFKSDPGRRI